MELRTIDHLFEITKHNLEGKHGTITINFANRVHVYSGNDVIGNCLQEWLPNWFSHLGIDIIPGAGSQSFPDFVLLIDNKTYDVEIKAWNILNAPAFDLANFQSFVETSYYSPQKIDAVYFVLGYRPVDDGFSEGFIVEKVFMKNLWELTAPSLKRPIGLQVKRGQPYAMRPYNFHRRPYNSFQSRRDFIIAVRDTFELFPNTSIPFTPRKWFLKMVEFYFDDFID